MNGKIMSTLLAVVLMCVVAALSPATDSPAIASPAAASPATVSPPTVSSAAASLATVNPAAAGPATVEPASLAGPIVGVGVGVGHTINFPVMGGGQKIAATVVDVADPASPQFGFDRAVLGNRLVGVGLKILNAGTSPYSGSPDRGAVLADKSGRSYRAVFKSISAGAPFSGTVDIDPGEARFGYLVFEVPKAFAIDSFQFRLGSGSDVQPGKWSIADAAAAVHGDPADLVKSYFGAINNGDCSAAWDLGGKNLGQPFDRFAAQFCDAVRDRVMIVSASGDTVRVRLDAEQPDGSHWTYAGTFLVQHGEIVGAQLQRGV